MTHQRTWKHYTLYACVWATGITAAGACVGAVAYPLFAVMTDRPADVASLALKGAKDIGFLAFIWAPGIGIVMAFHRGFLDRQRNRDR